MQITFEGANTFEAAHKADDWCRARGISVGQMQHDFPRGLLFGDYLISKWRGMNAAEKKALHGTMSGDMRHGPVTVTIKPEFEHLLGGPDNCGCASELHYACRPNQESKA